MESKLFLYDGRCASITTDMEKYRIRIKLSKRCLFNKVIVSASWEKQRWWQQKIAVIISYTCSKSITIWTMDSWRTLFTTHKHTWNLVFSIWLMHLMWTTTSYARYTPFACKIEFLISINRPNKLSKVQCNFHSNARRHQSVNHITVYNT